MQQTSRGEFMATDPGVLEHRTVLEGGDGQLEEIEILGPHLRVSGTLPLGRFKRISDLVNRGQGYVLLRQARLLRRNGEPTNLELAELLVNRDEITFIGQRESSGPSAEAAPTGFDAFDRPSIQKVSRRFVIFTPGHTITGDIHVYHEMTLAMFLDASDPRFVAMTIVRARSLADRSVISHFDLLVVNKTQITAAAEADLAAALAD
jgi:hypothetical protein